MKLQHPFLKPFVNDLLVLAAKSGDLEEVKKYIYYGADIYYDNNDALCYATQKGHAEIVKFLLEQDAKKVYVYDDKIQIFHEACEHGHLEIIKMLIEYDGIDIYINNNDKDYALAVACRGGHSEIAKILVKCGANIHYKNDMPLRDAVKISNIELVEFLLEHGAKANANNSEALWLAAKQGEVGIMEMLIEHGAQINANNGMALKMAVKEGEYESVKCLIEHGADMVETDNHLFTAISFGYLDIVKLLLKKGAATLHAKSFDNALRNAILSENMELVDFLIDYIVLYNCLSCK